MYPMMYGGYGSFGAFGWLWMIFWWALIIFGIVYLVKWVAGNSGSRGGDAREILRKRYAKGEIDREEFTEKLNDLE